MRVQQPATAPTDNFALFTAPFNKTPLTLPAVDVSAPTSTFYVFTGPSELHAPPLLQPAAAPQIVPHHLAFTFPYATLLFLHQKLQH